MTQKLLMLLVVSVLAIGPGLSFTSAVQENSVIIRPSYKKGLPSVIMTGVESRYFLRINGHPQKGQQSRKKLSFVIPQGWVKDEKAAKKLGLYSVLLRARN
jgi:hypothetical protein